MLRHIFCVVLLVASTVAVSPTVAPKDLSVPQRDSEPITYGSLCTKLSVPNIIRVALDYYSDDLDMAARYIMDHLQYDGEFVVHAHSLSGFDQGKQWQSVTNGDIFTGRSGHGCYFHDNRFYVLIVKYL
uniref:Conserved secreted protein n=1 Tax=Steinernema glaseri TaxID=37863 RepID=A0A1I7YL66_9BILA